MGDYLIAWVLPSSKLQAIARHYFEDIVNQYSSTCHVTYTFGKIGTHNVVLASPASDTDTPSINCIIQDLLQHAPAIRAGFLVSSNAIAPRLGIARIGDIVVGGILPLMQRGVIHLSDEETRDGKRLVITGESRNVSPSVADAIRHARSPQGLEDWKRCLYNHKHSSEAQSGIWKDDKPQLVTLYQDQPKALLGVIASSTRPIEDFELLANFTARNNILCFETAGATLDYDPFLVVAGVAKHFDDVPGQGAHTETCKAVISYLACLVNRIDHSKLALEPPVELQFRYEPLDLGQPGFRLLRLQGGKGRLKCHLFQAYLDDENLIPYEALSYCWGSDCLIETIRVNGRALAITSNLYLALTHLRFPDKDRILWIDAICIDQGNIGERGHQVDHMGDVYRRADQVLFWLGHADYDIHNLLLALQRCERCVPVDGWKRWPDGDPRFQVIWSNIQGSLENGNPSISSQRSRLESVVNNEWFGRVWVIQEVFNAQRASLGCTAGWINARTFALAPTLLEVEPSTQCQSIIDVMPGSSRRSSWWNQKPNLSTLLWKFRESQATEPKDRVFALLDISSDEPFKSDYTKTEEAVSNDLMAHMCRDHIAPRSLIYTSIAELQKLIPSLLSMDLNQFRYRGTQLEVPEQFKHRHNKQVFLSEISVRYLWLIRSPVQEQLMHDSNIIQVISAESSSGDVPEFTESLAAYLRPNKGPTATQDVLDILRDSEVDLVPMMLEQDRDDIEITEVLAMEAAKKGPVIFGRFLMKYGKKIVFTRDLSDEATRNGGSILDILLDNYNGQVKITDILVVDAIERGQMTVQLLFDLYPSQLEIGDEATLTAMKFGPGMLKLMQQACGERSIITQKVVQSAMEQGLSTFRFLFDGHGNRIAFADEMVYKAVDSGSHMLDFVVDQYGDQIIFTHEMLCRLIDRGSKILEFMLDRYGGQVMGTDDMVYRAIARGSRRILQVILDRYGDQITGTNDMVYMAIDQLSPHILKVVLNQYGDQITFINRMFRNALTRGSNMFQVILDTYGDHIEINDVVDTSFYCSVDSTALGLVFDRCGDRIQVPANVLNTMSQLGRKDNVNLLLDKYGDRADVVTALVRVENKWAFLMYAARFMVVRNRCTVYPWMRVLVSALGGALAQRFRPFAVLMAGNFNELLLDPSLLLEPIQQGPHRF